MQRAQILLACGTGSWAWKVCTTSYVPGRPRTHKHAKVRAWLAQRPRFHVHYMPTYASWLNQVERWFGLITWTATADPILDKLQRLCSQISGTGP